MTIQTKWDDQNKPECHKRAYDRKACHPGDSQHGRVTVWVECPFCFVKIECFSWSLSGSGKRCVSTCGALLGSFEAIKLMPVKDEAA